MTTEEHQEELTQVLWVCLNVNQHKQHNTVNAEEEERKRNSEEVVHPIVMVKKLQRSHQQLLEECVKN